MDKVRYIKTENSEIILTDLVSFQPLLDNDFTMKFLIGAEISFQTSVVVTAWHSLMYKSKCISKIVNVHLEFYQLDL